MAKLDVLTYGFAFVSDQGTFGFSSISLLTLGDRHILIDTGPASRRDLLVKALDSKGLAPEDVDSVILTHLHWDHCQNTDLFTNSRILVHPKELDYARNPARGDRSTAWYIADMMDKMKVEPVSDGDSVAEGVGIIDTPGHCRWSTIMSVVNRSGKMSVHERIDIDPERTGKAPSAQRYPGRSDISG